MEQFGDDLADLINALDLSNVVLVAHSMGGGEVSKYISRHGTSRVAKVVLVSAVPPLMVKTAANPHGTPLTAFDAIRKALAENRAEFFKDVTLPFFGYNREGAKVSEGIRESSGCRAIWPRSRRSMTVSSSSPKSTSPKT